MPIDPGTRFGPYEILGSVGAGGMGEVYRARDPRLGREVAVKVLPPQFAGDSDRLRRFETEARAAGALNHPNVLAVLDVGAENGHPYVVSELLEGETLRQRLRIAALTPKKAMELAVQIAHGLAAAHDKGIVHRDLKPENLFVTREGRVKILDFGLAKLTREGSPDEDVTLASGDTPAAGDAAATEAGAILGTVGYMSPEQVRGLPADPRSDIFSFGVVLYEMVSGRRAFARDTHAETLTAILKDDPPELALTHPNVPPALERVVRRCLEKSPDERFHSARDVAYAIDALSSSSPARGAGAPGEAAPTRRTRDRVLSGLGLGLLALGAGYVWRAAGERPAPDLGAYRFTPIAMEPGYEGFPAWSPDGNTLAYLREVDGVLQVFTRALSASTPAQITRSPRDCREPFWSPDGTHVYYLSQAAGDESLWRVSAAGGMPKVALRNVSYAALSPDGKALAFLREDGGHGGFFRSLWISSPPGAEPRRYSEPPLADRRFPTARICFAPDGSKIALWAVSAWDSGKRVTDADFWILPFPTGAPRRVDGPLSTLQDPYPFGWMPDSRHVVLGTDRGAETPGLHLYLADTESGSVEPLTATNGSESDPTVSPDSRKIAYTSLEEEYHLIEVPLDGSRYTSVLAGSRMETDPAWSPLGNQYAYVSGRTGRPEIWLRSRDGSFEKALVTSATFKEGASRMLAELAFSPDGQRIAYQSRGRNGFSIWISTIAGGPPVRLGELPGTTYVDFPTWSPDGDWVAFTYMLQGKWGLARVRSGGGEDAVVIKEDIVYPSSPRWSPRGDWITCDTPEGFALVSPDGKKQRLLTEETWLAHGWSKDGTTLYAVRQTEHLRFQLTSLDVSTGQERVVAEDLGPTPPTSSPLRGFSLAPDGRSFLTSIVRLRGDVWLLEGFARDEGLFARLFSRPRPRG